MTMKRIASPVMFPIARKSGGRFVPDPSAGPHPKEQCVPLVMVLRDVLHLGETRKELKGVIKNGKIMVDGRARKDMNYPVGLFDVVTVPEVGSYRMMPGKRLDLTKIDGKETGVKVCRINDKTTIKGGKTQLNLHDGRNIIVDKDSYRTGDSVVVSLPEQKITGHLKREEGAVCVITRGKKRGKLVTIVKVEEKKGSTINTVKVKAGDEEFEVPQDLVFVVGKDKPAIQIGEEV